MTWSLFNKTYKYTPEKLTGVTNSFIVAMKNNNWHIIEPKNASQSLLYDWKRSAVRLNGNCCNIESNYQEDLLTEFEKQATKAFSLTETEIQDLINKLNKHYGQFILLATPDSIENCIVNTLDREKTDNDFNILIHNPESYGNLTYNEKQKIFYLDVITSNIILRAPAITINYGFSLSGNVKFRYILTDNGFKLVHIKFDNKLLRDLVLDNSSEFLKFAKVNMRAYKARTELQKLLEQNPIYTESVSALIDTVDKINAKGGLTLEAAANIFENTQYLIRQPTFAATYEKKAYAYCKHINWIPYANSLAAAMATVACVAACVACVTAVGAIFVLFPPAGLASAAVLAGGIAGISLAMSGTGFFGRRFMQSLSVFSAKQVVKPMHAVAEVAKTQPNTNRSNDPLAAAKARGDVLIPTGITSIKP